MRTVREVRSSDKEQNEGVADPLKGSLTKPEGGGDAAIVCGMGCGTSSTRKRRLTGHSGPYPQ